MRPAIAVLIWLIIIGGLSAYMHKRETIRPGSTYEVQEASGNFAVEITTTFDVEPDPFALRTDSGTAAPAMLVRINGQDVLRQAEKVERGMPIRLEPVPALIQGHNELYIEANPPMDQTAQSLAMRVRVFQGNQPVADQSIWSEAGSKIAAALPVEIQPEKTPEKQPHGH
jgi:hypothetical protein